MMRGVIEYPLVMVQPRPADERRARVIELLDVVGISGQKHKYDTRV